MSVDFYQVTFKFCIFNGIRDAMQFFIQILSEKTLPPISVFYIQVIKII